MKRKSSIKDAVLANALIATGGLAATAATAAETLKVGVLTPLSGTYAPIGEQVKNGAELVVKEIDAAYEKVVEYAEKYDIRKISKPKVQHGHLQLLLLGHGR